MSKFLVEAFRSPDPSQDGRQVKVADVLDRASDQARQGVRRVAGDPGDAARRPGPDVLGPGPVRPSGEPAHEGRRRARGRAGPDHPDTLTSCNNLAIAYHVHRPASRGDRAARGDTQTTRGQAGPRPPRHASEPQQPRQRLLDRRPDSRGDRAVEATLKLREATLGPDHPDTLTTRNNLAVAYRLAGRTPEAIALHEATLKLREAKLGPDHPDTLQSRNNLAHRLPVGRPDGEAIALLEATLKLARPSWAPTTPTRSTTRNDLAAAYSFAGRLSRGDRAPRGDAQAARGQAGPRPPRDARRAATTSPYAYPGRPAAEAIALHEATLKLREAKLGPDHPDTLESRNSLA